MIDIIIVILLGYWLGKKEEPRQRDQEYTGSIEYNGMDYGYVKEENLLKI